MTEATGPPGPAGPSSSPILDCPCPSLCRSCAGSWCGDPDFIPGDLNPWLSGPAWATIAMTAAAGTSGCRGTKGQILEGVPNSPLSHRIAAAVVPHGDQNLSPAALRLCPLVHQQDRHSHRGMATSSSSMGLYRVPQQKLPASGRRKHIVQKWVTGVLEGRASVYTLCFLSPNILAAGDTVAYLSCSESRAVRYGP